MGIVERQQEQNLYEVKEFLVSIMGSAPYGIMAFDLEGDVVMTNSFAIEYLGKDISVNNAVGRNIRDLIKGIPQLVDSLETLFEEGRKPFDLPYIQIKNKFILINGRLITNGYVLAMQDITELKQTEYELAKRTNELSAANIQLQKADQMKSAFLANMSHELRTPLNSILGFTGMVLMGLAGELNPEQTKQLKIVKRNGKHLLSLINDILDISKIESGKTELLLEKFIINEVIEEIIDTVNPMVEGKGIELLEDIHHDIEIRSDQKLVKQILLNLIGNAVKFTDQGSVTIKARVLKSHLLEVNVIDTGVGIKKTDLKKLFGVFQQVDMSSTKKHKGTGLGLYLSKQLVTQLGGDIAVKSNYKRGSEFTLTLPLDYGKDG